MNGIFNFFNVRSTQPRMGPNLNVQFSDLWCSTLTTAVIVTLSTLCLEKEWCWISAITVPNLNQFSELLQRGRIACNAESCNSYDNSVRLSHTGTLSRQIKIKLQVSSPRGNKNTLVFWHQQRLGGDVHFHQKFELKFTHPFWKPPTSTNICLLRLNRKNSATKFICVKTWQSCSKTSHFKFGLQLGFAKAHHQMSLEENVGVALS